MSANEAWSDDASTTIPRNLSIIITPPAEDERERHTLSSFDFSDDSGSDYNTENDELSVPTVHRRPLSISDSPHIGSEEVSPDSELEEEEALEGYEDEPTEKKTVDTETMKTTANQQVMKEVSEDMKPSQTNGVLKVEDQKTASPKKSATKHKDHANTKDYELVIKQVKHIQTRNLELIVQNHVPQLFEFRDTVYKQARDAGITEASSRKARLQVIKKVVEWYVVK
ncbi:hypothetical protein RFI_28027 [Reticulomyxa filosa]|uniref:Uncharacterized protein n=1 Tax=Reticulomyxa filosa TaxID=46433 RepID=X6M5T0_RETFI|nr:hypothetical protein RFI_28027 [Reticulomyxa filosa]|eukprot:ETO09348.1 hypothetical protein RFI_28027 [Reticulomyxa filosa]